MKQMSKTEVRELLRNTKMKVTPEQSEAIQKLAFRVGYHWGRAETLVKHTDSPYLYFYDGPSIFDTLRIYEGHTEYAFNKNKRQELKPEDIFDIELI